MSNITKADVRAMVDAVAKNNRLLNACPGHVFVRVEPDKLCSKQRCDRCGGTVVTEAAHWYNRGVAHGRNPA